MEVARRAMEEGRRVLFVCFNHILGAWLEERAVELRPQVYTGTLHRWMLTVAGLARAPQDADSAFWVETPAAPTTSARHKVRRMDDPLWPCGFQYRQVPVRNMT